jgi:hypothetical protein
MAREDFVAVTGDDWYQRRRQDAEGEFFRKMASQGPRKGEGGSTRQGIYCLTASGKLLAYKNAGQAPEVMRETLQHALAEWRKLPAGERQPGAVKVEELPRKDPQYTRTPPPDALVVNVFTRLLDRSSNGTYSAHTCPAGRGGESARDHLWITSAEWKALLPRDVKPGDKLPVPPSLTARLLRFHLIDNTRGEPPHWRREEIRKSDLTLMVEEHIPSRCRLRLEGQVLLATDADPAKADRGYEARIQGRIAGDPTTPRITRFDMLVLGEHWGQGPFTRGARPGRSPLGIVFELAKGEASADRVPPQGAREINEYLGSRP